MTDRNRNQWDERWQNRNDRNQYDRSRDDYSSNYGNTEGLRYGGEDYRSDAPHRSNNNNYNHRNERRDDYSDLDKDRGRSTNMGNGYDPYNYEQTVGSFNQGKEGSYTSQNEKRGYAPSYDRMFDNDAGYDSDYNRSYGRRPSDNSYGTGSYYGNNYRDRHERRDTNRGDWQRDRGGYSHSSKNRDWWDRATDEVASWFGDDDAERRRDIDRRTGPHRGKGPKGYSRSDERIRDDVNDRLSDDSFVDASEIEVTCEGNEIVLTGTVDTKEEKRRAEDIAERISGVKNVENRLKVRSKENSGGSTIYRDRD